MNENCANCSFWAGDGDDETGECRRYPPVVIMGQLKKDERYGDHEYVGVFPETIPLHWCGEWKHDGTPNAE